MVPSLRFASRELKVDTILNCSNHFLPTRGCNSHICKRFKLVKCSPKAWEQLEVLGSVSVQVEYKDQLACLPLLVVQGSGSSLLGRNWLKKLRLDWPEIHQLQETGTCERILQKHQQVFKEELGEIKGIKAQISIDPQAQPRFTPCAICSQEQGGKGVGTT